MYRDAKTNIMSYTPPPLAPFLGSIAVRIVDMCSSDPLLLGPRCSLRASPRGCGRTTSRVAVVRHPHAAGKSSALHMGVLSSAARASKRYGQLPPEYPGANRRAGLLHRCSLRSLTACKLRTDFPVWMVRCFAVGSPPLHLGGTRYTSTIWAARTL